MAKIHVKIIQICPSIMKLMKLITILVALWFGLNDDRSNYNHDLSLNLCFLFCQFLIVDRSQYSPITGMVEFQRNHLQWCVCRNALGTAIYVDYLTEVSLNRRKTLLVYLWYLDGYRTIFQYVIVFGPKFCEAILFIYNIFSNSYLQFIIFIVIFHWKHT